MFKAFVCCAHCSILPAKEVAMPAAYRILEPTFANTSVVFGSPHSGRVYPADLMARAQVDPLVLRSSEDAFVDLLLSNAPAVGAPLITSDVPRAYVDFNRAPDEMDPALIEGAPRVSLNPRVGSGLGVIARVVAGNRAIYRGKIPMAEAQGRIDRYWHPYHRALGGLLERQRRRFGQVFLCDVHSMPHEALGGHALRLGRRPQIVLGDRFGASCDPRLVDAVEGVFRRAGLVVSRNTPFAGAYIAQRYGQPAQNIHVLQIEIDRALYLDEARVEPNAAFPAFRALMDEVVEAIARLGRVSDAGGRLAAE
jgi:N-formylglutamate amidohydrolase